MRSVLVTGATGFIGQQLVKCLLAEHVSVRALVRDPAKASHLPSAVELFQGDLTKAESLHGVCQGIDTVFHVAGLAHAWAEKSALAADQHRAINLQGTEALLEAARHVHAFVYFSTVKAVADSATMIDESFQALPDCAYGLAKRAAEALVLQSPIAHVCVLRPTLVYGPGCKGNLALMLKLIDRGYFLPVPEVNNKRSMIGLVDMCRAALLAATLPPANRQTYIVSDGHTYTTRQLYDTLRHALKLKPRTWAIPYGLLAVAATCGDVFGWCLRRRFVFDSQALHKLTSSAHYQSHAIYSDLGFKAEQNFRQAAVEMVEYYRQHSL